MIELRRLTAEEDKKFQELCKIDDNNLDIKNFPGKKLSSVVELNEDKKFNNKFELGKYLYEKLSNIPVDIKTWHFLVIAYHKKLLNSKGKIGETKRFYINSEKRYYPFTHLLKPVFDLYSFYRDTPDSIEFLLLSPVNESGKLFLETVKRQDMMKNINFIEVSRRLFYDEKKKKLKKGIAESILRLITLFKQYERTYDLYSMPADKILENLIRKHKEFDTLMAN